MVTEQLDEIYARMADAAERTGRTLDDVTLVAVSKGQPPEAIMAAYDHGHRVFGENRAGELADKAPGLPSDIVWHFIGSLQTRQAKIARPHTRLLHSLDRPRLVNSWSGAEPPPALVQVNVAAEPQKHGVAPGETAALLELARERELRCIGLMCIPPLVTDAEDNRRWFSELRELRDRLRDDFPDLTELSMGMTDDYEVAIEEGATLIRVGRAIFGAPGTGID